MTKSHALQGAGLEWCHVSLYGGIQRMALFQLFKLCPIGGLEPINPMPLAPFPASKNLPPHAPFT